MPTHEERIVGREVGSEIAERSFQLRWPIRQQDKVGFLRIADQG